MSNTVRESVKPFVPTSPLQVALTVLAVSIGYATFGVTGAVVGAVILPAAVIGTVAMVAGLVLLLVGVEIEEGVRHE